MEILILLSVLMGLVASCAILVVIIKGYELTKDLFWETLEFTFRAGSHFLNKILGR
jgi:hypothetical protein